MPVTPVALENVTLPGFLDEERVLLLSYQGQKPLSEDVHTSLANWVKKGGVLVMVDDDKDPYNRVREWWNDEGKTDRIPRQHLFQTLGVTESSFAGGAPSTIKVGKGAVIWVKENPVRFALSAEADARLIAIVKKAALEAGLNWSERNYLAMRRGPYLIGAGLDESIDGPSTVLKGRFVNLFDSELKVHPSVELKPGNRFFLLDLNKMKTRGARLLASACKVLPIKGDDDALSWTVEGVGETPAIVLVSSAKPPRSIAMDDQGIETYTYDAREGLLWIRFRNEARPRNLTVRF
jgi:hypothetical protein